MTPPQDRSAKKQSSWDQGSYLLGETVDALADAEVVPPDWTGQGYALAISHPCDVAADVAVEPYIEFVLARPVERPDGNFRYAKSARTLRIESNVAGLPTALALSIHDRVRVRRGDLVPPEGRLDREAVQLVALWVSRRYSRSAFPDAFNDRLRIERRAMRRLLQRDGSALSGIYFYLSSQEELDESTVYELAIRATMTVNNYDDAGLRAHCQGTLDSFVGLLGSVEGVEIVDHELCDEGSMSLDDLRFYQRWDVDDLTLRLEGSELPPDG